MIFLELKNSWLFCIKQQCCLWAHRMKLLLNTFCPVVLLSIFRFVQSFFPKLLVEVFWFFCAKQRFFLKKKCFLGGFWDKRFQKGHKMASVKFYEKLTRGIFLIFYMKLQQIKSWYWMDFFLGKKSRFEFFGSNWTKRDPK